MAFKEFNVTGIGAVTVYKRRGTGSLRLSIRHDGTIRVTIPAWMPYATGTEFVRARAKWVQEHALPPTADLENQQLIGKAHRLRFEPSTTSVKPTSRVKQSQIIITHPATLSSSEPVVQKLARQASIRALRAQAERLLPIRLSELAKQHGFDYRSVSIKQLQGRWGSCDQNRNIVLNLFLMQLPWRLIDYVLLHELTHTNVMKHGPEFWSAMAHVEPNTPQIRKEIKAYKPAI